MASHVISQRTQNRATLISAAQIIGASLLIALCAQIRIPLPFSPIPLTFQTFAVLLIGSLLGSKKGALSVIAYLAEVSLGLPFLQGGMVNPFALVGITAGYLIGFVVQAYFVGWFFEKRKTLSFGKTLSVLSLACLVQLALGTLWLAHFVGWNNDLPMGFYPFVPSEVLKAMAVISLFRK